MSPLTAFFNPSVRKTYYNVWRSLEKSSFTGAWSTTCTSCAEQWTSSITSPLYFRLIAGTRLCYISWKDRGDQRSKRINKVSSVWARENLAC